MVTYKKMYRCVYVHKEPGLPGEMADSSIGQQIFNMSLEQKVKK
jgi:hypothetical protein